MFKLPRPEWGTKADAASYLGVSVRTIERMVNAGEIRAVRMRDGRVRIDMNSLDAALAPIWTEDGAA